MFADLSYVDFGDYDVLVFDVVYDNVEYNLQLAFVHLDEDDTFKEGMILRTTIFEESLEAIGEKMAKFFELGLFDNLTPMSNGSVLSVEGALIQEVNWNEYCPIEDITPQIVIPEHRVLH